MMNNTKDIRVLFFHNTLPEYRLAFFEELSKKCKLKIVFTDYSMSEKIYGSAADEERIAKLDAIFLQGSKLSRIKKVTEILLKKNMIG